MFFGRVLCVTGGDLRIATLSQRLQRVSVFRVCCLPLLAPPPANLFLVLTVQATRMYMLCLNKWCKSSVYSSMYSKVSGIHSIYRTSRSDFGPYEHLPFSEACTPCVTQSRSLIFLHMKRTRSLKGDTYKSVTCGYYRHDTQAGSIHDGQSRARSLNLSSSYSCQELPNTPLIRLVSYLISRMCALPLEVVGTDGDFVYDRVYYRTRDNADV